MRLPVAIKILFNSEVVGLEVLAYNALLEVIDAPEGSARGEMAVEGLESGLAELSGVPVCKIFKT